jgi:hypothetical protein
MLTSTRRTNGQSLGTFKPDDKCCSPTPCSVSHYHPLLFIVLVDCCLCLLQSVGGGAERVAASGRQRQSGGRSWQIAMSFVELAKWRSLCALCGVCVWITERHSASAASAPPIMPNPKARPMSCPTHSIPLHGLSARQTQRVSQFEVSIY